MLLYHGLRPSGSSFTLNYADGSLLTPTFCPHSGHRPSFLPLFTRLFSSTITFWRPLYPPPPQSFTSGSPFPRAFHFLATPALISLRHGCVESTLLHARQDSLHFLFPLNCEGVRDRNRSREIAVRVCSLRNLVTMISCFVFEDLIREVGTVKVGRSMVFKCLWRLWLLCNAKIKYSICCSKFLEENVYTIF